MVLILLLQGSASLKTFAEVNQRNADTLARIKYATAVSAQTEASSVFISRRYGDHFILYGDRVALMPDMLVSREPGRYREEEFAPTLVVVVGNLLQQGIPVYVIEDGMAGTRIGFFDPMPVLRQHFQVNQCPGPAPAMYRVRQTGTMKDEATGC
jgi:hypothetical protein